MCRPTSPQYVYCNNSIAPMCYLKMHFYNYKKNICVICLMSSINLSSFYNNGGQLWSGACNFGQKRKKCSFQYLQVLYSIAEYLTLKELKSFLHTFHLFSHNVDSKLVETLCFVKISKITEDEVLKLFSKLKYLLKRHTKTESVYHSY